MNIRIFFIFALLITLPGCADSLVKEVKESPSDNPDYTYGQFFDNRPHCEKTTWQSKSDSRGRDIVEYTCIHKGIEESKIQERADSRLSRINEREERRRNIFYRAKEILENELEDILERGPREPSQSQIKSEQEIDEMRDKLNREKERLSELLDKNPDRENRISPDRENRISWARQDVERAESALYRAENIEELLKDRWEEEVEEIQQRVDRINEIAYIETLEEYHEKDINSIQSLFFDDIELKERVVFLVTENRIQIDRYNLIINDEVFSANYDDAQRLGIEMARPDASGFSDQWERRWLSLLTEKSGSVRVEREFPFYCSTTPDYGLGVSGVGCGRNPAR